jgi:hypothetical protein
MKSAAPCGGFCAANEGGVSRRKGAPMTLRDISVDENRGGFCAANEGGVSRRK